MSPSALTGSCCDNPTMLTKCSNHTRPLGYVLLAQRHRLQLVVVIPVPSVPSCAQLPLQLAHNHSPNTAYALPPPPAYHFLAGTLLLMRCQGLELDTSPPATDAATAPLPDGVDMVRATVLRSFSSVSACLQVEVEKNQHISVRMMSLLKRNHPAGHVLRHKRLPARIRKANGACEGHGLGVDASLFGMCHRRDIARR